MPAATIALLLVIRTYDIFGVSASDLRVAQWTSANILQPAGIELRWIDCTRSDTTAAATCTDVPTADELLVRIMAAPGNHRSGRPGHDPLGYAYVDVAAGTGSLATLYADRIARIAGESGVDAATILGRAMAHEIGHLLLGTARHQPNGLMRAEWTPQVLQRRIGNDWQFSRGEIKELARNLELRISNPNP